MDSQTNLNANNNPLNIGLDPNLHPLLAPESILPTTIHPTSLLAPLEVQTPLTAANTIYTDGATNPHNILYAPLPQDTTSHPILNSLLSSINPSSTKLNPTNLNPPPISYASAALVITAPPQPSHNFAIQAGGIVTFNGKSDLDGNPIDLTDDAFVYAGRGFSLNGESVLPVARDSSGKAIKTSQGKLTLLDQAIVVAPGYIQSNSNGNNNYANLTPPQVIAKQTITIPSYADIKQQELATHILPGATTVTFSTAPAQNKFPTGGTATLPKVVRITNGGLNLPGDVSLSNLVIIVDNGDINFNGESKLTNVVFVANNGNVNLNKIEATNSSFLASGRINVNSKVELGGKTVLATAQGDITFNGEIEGTDNSIQNLEVIAQGRITLNGSSEVRGDFRSTGTFSTNGKADIYGTVASLGDIVFNGASTFTYANLGNIQPHVPTLQLVATSDSGISNSDGITNINTPTINGTGDIGTMIKIKDGNVLVGQAIVGSDGKWQVDTNSLVNGTHSLTAVAIDLAGNTSIASAPLNLIIDSIAPQLILNSPLSILNSTTKLTGSINGTGSSIASINYYWDNSTNLIPIAPNTTGGFDQALNYTGIANGTHKITIVSKDIAGNIATSSYNVTVAIAAKDTQAPVITAKLSSDTGVSNSDKITFTPTITGTITDASQIVGFKASFDGINYVNILTQKQPDGTFTLDKTQLTTVAGKALVDGNYILHLIATDEFGNTSGNYDVAFTLDTTITIPANLKLDTASDTGASNSDNITNINTPIITGTGDIGATIKLTEGSNIVTSQ
jgi:Bacterial Ig-like domain